MSNVEKINCQTRRRERERERESEREKKCLPLRGTIVKRE